MAELKKLVREEGPMPLETVGILLRRALKVLRKAA